MSKFIKVIIVLEILTSLNLMSAESSDDFLKEKLVLVKNLFSSNNDSCIKIAEEALFKTMDAENSLVQVELIELLGLAYKNFGFNQKGIEKFYEALFISEKLKNKAHIAYNYRMLGDAYRVAILYDKSIDFINKSLNFYDSINDSANIAESYNRLGGVYFELFNSTDTLDFVKRMKYKNLVISSIYQAIQIGKKISSNDIICSSYNVLGAFYNYNHQQDSSLYYYNIALELTNYKNTSSCYPELLIGKANLLINEKKYKEALLYAQKVSDFLHNKIAPGYKKEYLSIRYLCYWKMGLHEKALLTLDSLNKFQVILFDNTLKSNTKITQSYYENQRNLQQIQMTKQRIVYSIIFICMVLILLSIIILILKRSNKNQHKINSELILANQTKDKFFTIIAHDLKSPLSSLKNVTELLADSYNDFTEEDRIDFLRLMKDSTKSIYSLLENLLEWSRSQRGLINYNPKEINISILLNDILKLLNPIAENKKIKLISAISATTTLIAESNMLNTVIRNLISNSIKFTQENGKISINEKNEDDFTIISI